MLLLFRTGDVSPRFAPRGKRQDVENGDVNPKFGKAGVAANAACGGASLVSRRNRICSERLSKPRSSQRLTLSTRRLTAVGSPVNIPSESGYPTVATLDEIIVALASTPGAGARGIVRLSGPNLQHFLTPLFAEFPQERGVQSTSILLPNFASPLPVDVYYMPGPHSYTGQDCVELHVVSSPPLLEALITTLLNAGARAAQPGEFTMRAFLNGKMDLSQAEAVGDPADHLGQRRPVREHVQGRQLTRFEQRHRRFRRKTNRRSRSRIRGRIRSRSDVQLRQPQADMSKSPVWNTAQHAA